MASWFRPEVPVALLISTISCLIFTDTASGGAPPREGHTKIIVGNRYLLAAPNASAPPPITLLSGLAGEVLATYDDSTLVSVHRDLVRLIHERARVGRIEVTPRDDFDLIHINGRVIDVRAGTSRSVPGERLDPPYESDEWASWIIQFRGPAKGDWLEGIEAEGVSLVQYVPYNAYIAAARPSVIPRVLDLPYVQFVDRMHTFMKPTVASGVSSPQLLWVQIAATESTGKAVERLEKLSLGGIRTEPWSSKEMRVEGTFEPAHFEHIVRESLVIAVALRPTIALSDERVSLSLTNLPFASSGSLYKRKWLAETCPDCGNLAQEGYRIGIADTGLDGGGGPEDTIIPPSGSVPGEPPASGRHRADLNRPRLIYGSYFGPPAQGEWPGQYPDSTGTNHDVYGHGTLVAGIAAGDSDAGPTDTEGYYWGMGVAPSAGLVMTRINFFNIGTLSSRPVADVARDALMNGAFVQNHSYNQYVLAPPPGGPSTPPCWSRFDGLYTTLSRDFDASAIDANALTQVAEPILLTVSAGNVDQQRGIFPPGSECPDYHLTLPPATAKNVLSVGMSESVRPDSHLWNCAFALAEDHHNIASNTKTGTATSGWFKPDLMAPAANIVSNGSFDIAASQPEGFCRNFEAPPPPGVPSEYIASTGTSFAAPAAAGAALLASRYYAQYLIDRGMAAGPSTATPPLLKAMLIAGAQSMRGGRDRSRVFTWQPVQSFMKTGDLVIPRIPNGHVYQATNDGASGPLDPPWNPSAGSLTQDTASSKPYVWREVGSEFEVGAAPDSRQGFGRLHLEDVLSQYPARHFVNDNQSVVAGQSWTNTYRVHDESQAVRIALVWADPPAAVAGDFIAGSPLVNDLDLFVQFGTQCASRYIGNWISAFDVSNLDEGCQQSEPIDRNNNVEVVKFFATGPEFIVQVYGASVTQSQRFALVVLNAYDADDPAPPGTPAGVLATAASTGSVRVTWSASTGATSYEIQRRDGIDDPYVTVATTSALLFDDATVSGGAAYLYRVRARNVTAVSGFSSVDLATTVALSDKPVAAGQTLIRAAHVLELRDAVNAVRLAAGLPPLAWTDPFLTPGMNARAAHVAELRSGLAAARSTLGVAPVSFTDATLTAMTSVIRAVHVNELQSGIE